VGRARSGEKLRLDPTFLDGCAEAERAYREAKNYCDEESRGLLKSTKGILFHAWVLGLFPNMSIGHFSNRDEEGEDRNAWLQEVMRSAEYKAVFPQKKCWLIERGKHACSLGRTTLHGKTNKSNPNVQAKGIESARAGPHFDRLWIDDVVDERTSIVMPAKKTHIKNTYYNIIEKMVDDPVIGKRIGKPWQGLSYFSGTPYATDDLWAEIVRRARANPDRWVYRRLACGGPPDFYSPMPNVLSPETLRERFESSERAYRMAYMLEPLGEGERIFTRIHFWLPANFSVKSKLVDTLGYKPGAFDYDQLKPEKRTWPCLMAVDPGFSEGRGSCFTGITVGMLSPEGVAYIVYALQFRAAWNEGRERVRAVADRFKPNRFLLESGAQQIAALGYFQEHGIPFAEAVGTDNRKKWVRALDVAGHVNDGRVMIPGRAAPDGLSVHPLMHASYGNIPLLYSHLATCPVVDNWDLIDSFVYCIQGLCGGPRPIIAPRPKVVDVNAERWEVLSKRMFGEDDPQDRDESWDAVMEESWALVN
ncbi:MAG: hypothetical protein V1929_05500, partial [bacterium]